MNIKSLLLGSAAALVAVTGARAADAVVVAEPEPMDYVRICDVYGTGFYYVPGTETCIRVGGYIRYDIGAGDLFGLESADKEDLAGGVVDINDTFYKRARAALQLDARQETEFGTLRGYMHINYNYDTITVAGPGGVPLTSTADGFGINHAYIELGGFRIGKTDSLFSTFTGYAGGVINDDIIGYGPFGTHQIAYTFTSGPFSAAVALEEGSGTLYTLDSYVPHVVGGVSYSAGMFGVSGVVGYDSVWGEWAGKVRVDVKASDTISAFIMGGLKSDDTTPNFYGNWGGDWALWGGMSAAVTDKATVNVQLSYDDAEQFAAVANVDYKLARNFSIIPEVAYYDNNVDDGEFGGFLRLQYSFGR